MARDRGRAKALGYSNPAKVSQAYTWDVVPVGIRLLIVVAERVSPKEFDSIISELDRDEAGGISKNGTISCFHFDRLRPIELDHLEIARGNRLRRFCSARDDPMVLPQCRAR